MFVRFRRQLPHPLLQRRRRHHRHLIGKHEQPPGQIIQAPHPKRHFSPPIGLHLLELRSLSVRGCVRVTGTGVEAVVEGCRDLELFDVSQCKNLGKWIEAGGVQMVRQRGRAVKFETVADGKWRVGRQEA